MVNIHKLNLENVTISKLPLKTEILMIKSSHIKEDKTFLFADQDHIKEISMNESYIDVYYKLGLERLKDKNLPLREAVSSDYKILEQFFLNNFIN